ncbi:class IIb bacteriocin, lactobin A/cerein 7B family [Bombella favorum]|uniref:Uncharacterized protein n=1 Tax=Bombella favorum TaxID=2039164 RepID=A0ABR5ZMJ2_9PROT|nr:class IIb bacteriocin, lactobin A/cerein 7B family [Bombella favorum]MBA5725539.1 hypothetical protein [Bombella favorum]
MRTLNEHELNEVSGGCLLLGAAITLGGVLLNGLLSSERKLIGQASSGTSLTGNGDSSMSQSLAGAQADMAEHGTPLPRRVRPGLDSFLQNGASFLEALTHDAAGHISAGIRDFADLLGRLV